MKSKADLGNKPPNIDLNAVEVQMN